MTGFRFLFEKSDTFKFSEVRKSKHFVRKVKVSNHHNQESRIKLRLTFLLVRAWPIGRRCDRLTIPVFLLARQNTYISHVWYLLIQYSCIILQSIINYVLSNFLGKMEGIRKSSTKPILLNIWYWYCRRILYLFPLIASQALVKLYNDIHESYTKPLPWNDKTH